MRKNKMQYLLHNLTKLYGLSKKIVRAVKTVVCLQLRLMNDGIKNSVDNQFVS